MLASAALRGRGGGRGGGLLTLGDHGTLDGDTRADYTLTLLG